MMAPGGRRARVGTGSLCLVLLALTLGALGHVAVRARHLEVARALGEEQSLYQELEDEHRHLKIQLGQARRPLELERRARQELGMVYPSAFRRVLPGAIPGAIPGAGATP
jgi:cell division protein FtsL